MLKGYRTYVLGAVTIIGALATYLIGDTSLTEAINLIVTAGMGMFIRSGVDTAVAKVAPK